MIIAVRKIYIIGMIHILLRHQVLQTCINVFFDKLQYNFRKPNDLPRLPPLPHIECPAKGEIYYDLGISTYVVLEEADDDYGGLVGDVWEWCPIDNTWYSTADNDTLREIMEELYDGKEIFS